MLTLTQIDQNSMANEKFSFSFPSKSSKSNTTNRPLPFSDNKTTAKTASHFVTEFDSSLPAPSASSLFVIPPLINNFHSKLKSSLADLTFDQYPQFVVENLNSVSKENISYGLTVRSKPNNEEKRILSQEEEKALKRFREDMKNLPDHLGMDEYKEVPVENFGEAVLAGYRWKKGTGIGKNAKEDIKVVQYEGRSGKYGLGFDPKIHGARKGRRRGELVFADTEMKACVYGDLKKGCVDSLKELDIGDDNCDDNKEGSENSPSRMERSHVQWLRSHIKIKVVSENFEGGKWYMKKGEVMDVVGQTICDILMENGEIIQGVDQEMLETALPEIGGSVVVLYGRHEGVYGQLVEKDIEKEVGVVKELDSLEFMNVSLDQIAEYVGDPSYLGY